MCEGDLGLAIHQEHARVPRVVLILQVESRLVERYAGRHRSVVKALHPKKEIMRYTHGRMYHQVCVTFKIGTHAVLIGIAGVEMIFPAVGDMRSTPCTRVRGKK